MTSGQEVALTNKFVADNMPQCIRYVTIDDVNSEIYTDEYIEWLKQQAHNYTELVENIKNLLSERSTKLVCLKEGTEGIIMGEIGEVSKYIEVTCLESEIDILKQLINSNK